MDCQIESQRDEHSSKQVVKNRYFLILQKWEFSEINSTSYH